MAKNTALGAKEEHKIVFKDTEHENFYYTYLSKCRWQDVYHKALVYCLGLSDDTRKNVNRIYDFKTGSIKPECLHEGWQTSGSGRIVRIARMEHRLPICTRMRRNRSGKPGFIP